MRLPKHLPKGFSLTELTISLGLSSILAIAAYQGVGGTVKSGTENMARGNRDYRRVQHAAQLQAEVSNIVSLRADIGRVSSSHLGNLNVGGKFVPSGIVPFPGFTKEDIDERNANAGLAPKPSEAAGGWIDDDGNPLFDAIRLAYFPKESETLFLAIDPSTGATFPTAQDETPNQEIYLLSKGNLKVGDFAVISDNVSSDLFRITGLQEEDGYVKLEHSDEISIWNLPFHRNYGETIDHGEAYVQTVRVVTYAYSPQDKTIYKDDHVHDDFFNPKTGSFSAPDGNFKPGLSSAWSPVSEGVRDFDISYLLTFETETRYPTANYPDDKLTDNHLGFPRLLHLKFRTLECDLNSAECNDPDLDAGKITTYAQLLAPENLRRTEGLTGTGINTPHKLFNEFPRPEPSGEDPEDEEEEESGGGGGGCTVDCGGASSGDTDPPIGGGGSGN